MVTHRSKSRAEARLLIAKHWVGKRFSAKEFFAWAKTLEKQVADASVWDFHKAKEEFRRSGYLRRVSTVKSGPTVIFELLRQPNETGPDPLIQELGAILKLCPDSADAHASGPDTETRARTGGNVKIDITPHLCAVERKLRIAVKALEEIRREDGLGLDMSPPGPCYDIATKATREIENIT